jgi:hypothetical protein
LLADIAAVGMLLIGREDKVHGAVEIRQSDLNLLVCCAMELLNLHEGAPLVSSLGPIEIMKAHLFRAELAERAPEQLFRGILSRTITRQDPLWTLGGQVSSNQFSRDGVVVVGLCR